MEIIYEHVAATFSCCSNITNHEETVFEKSNGDTQELVDRMVKIQLNHQQAASEFMLEKHF